MPGPSRMRSSVKMSGVVMGCLMAFEGVKLVAYRDPVGIPTICFGETRGVKMGDRVTLEECKAMLGNRAQEFEQGIRSCLFYPDNVPDGAYAASISFAYNLGVGTYCKSSIVRLMNKGQYLTACDRFLFYDKAAGIRLPGLVKRRAAEREICRKDKL